MIKPRIFRYSGVRGLYSESDFLLSIKKKILILCHKSILL